MSAKNSIKNASFHLLEELKAKKQSKKTAAFVYIVGF